MLRIFDDRRDAGRALGEDFRRLLDQQAANQAALA
jgi:hypothetical protein